MATVSSINSLTEDATALDNLSPSQIRVAQIISELRANPDINQFFIGVEYTKDEQELALANLRKKNPDKEYSSTSNFHHFGTKLRSGNDTEWGFSGSIIEELVKFTMSADPFVVVFYLQSIFDAMTVYTSQCIMSGSETFMRPKIEKSYKDILAELLGKLMHKSPLSAICSSYNEKCTAEGDFNSQTMTHFRIEDVFGSKSKQDIDRLNTIADVIRDIMRETDIILEPNAILHLVRDVTAQLGDCELDPTNVDPIVRDWIVKYKENPVEFKERLDVDDDEEADMMADAKRHERAAELASIMREVFADLGYKFQPIHSLLLMKHLDRELVMAVPFDKVALYNAIREIVLTFDMGSPDPDSHHTCNCENCTCESKSEVTTTIPGSDTTH